MKKSLLLLLIFLTASHFLSAQVKPSGEESLVKWLSFKEAFEMNKKQAKPFLIDIYTDWCGYCRKFNKNILAKPEVQKALSGFIKIRVNPERGARENQITEQTSSLFRH